MDVATSTQTPRSTEAVATEAAAALLRRSLDAQADQVERLFASLPPAPPAPSLEPDKGRGFDAYA
jgi:hypothetical protein